MAYDVDNLHIFSECVDFSHKKLKHPENIKLIQLIFFFDWG